MSSTVEDVNSNLASVESFYDRKPSVEFKPPTPDWGYLAQVNEKFKTQLTWDVERIVGEPAHRAMFQCTPGKSRPFSSCIRDSQLTLSQSIPQQNISVSWKSVSVIPVYPAFCFRFYMTE